MTYAFMYDVPITAEIYARIKEGLGPERPPGLIAHLALQVENGLRYIDVWESEEACTRAFDERIHAAVDAAFGGHRPSTEPESHVLDVIDITGIPVAGAA